MIGGLVSKKCVNRLVNWMFKLLLLGSTGLLGQAIYREAEKRGVTICGVARSSADVNINISDDIALISIIQTEQPDIVINTCAIVNHEICEKNHQLAYEVNSRPSSILTQLSLEYNFYYVYISTDGFYSGDVNKKHTPDCHISLLNEYARTKFAGECFTLINPNSLVIRTNIIGFKNKRNNTTFIEWVVDTLKCNNEVTLFTDYYTSSITVNQFSKALLDILIIRPSGILNLASSEVFSKAELIKRLALSLNLNLSNARYGSLNSYTNVKRAESLGLDVSKAEEILGYRLPNLDDVIKEITREYYELESRNQNRFNNDWEK